LHKSVLSIIIVAYFCIQGIQITDIIAYFTIAKMSVYDRV